jgi:hypothetical protein
MARDKTPALRDHALNAPPSASAIPAESMALAQAMAKQLMPDAVQLWAETAFSSHTTASTWTRVQCARMVALVAGAFPEAAPMTPAPPLYGGTDGHAHHHHHHDDD